jgi:hypothetical protein
MKRRPLRLSARAYRRGRVYRPAEAQLTGSAACVSGRVRGGCMSAFAW